MDTLTDLENAIGTITDVTTRADAWLHAGAKQTDRGNYSNAVSMLTKARDLVANFFEAGQAKDYMVSQLAFEFARARDTAKAQTALQYIEDSEIEDQARARIATQASMYSLNIAQNIISTISDTIVKDNAIASVAYERAKLGNVIEAITISNTMSDSTLISGVQNQAIRLASEVIT